MTSPSFHRLSGLPPYGPPALSFPAEWGLRGAEGLVVQFTLPDGQTWVGNFQPGMGRLDSVVRHPNGVDVVVVAAGAGWIVDVAGHHAIELNIWADAIWTIDDPPGIVFSLQGAQFLCVGRDGVLWRSRQISWDGFRRIELSARTLTGEARDATSDAWIPFSVDLHTGTVTGGACRDEALAHRRLPAWLVRALRRWGIRR